VRERPRTAAGQHHPDRGAGQPAAHAGEIGGEVGLPDQVRSGRIKDGRPADQHAGRGVESHQVAAMQLGMVT
jgi:hypothetical protein